MNVHPLVVVIFRDDEFLGDRYNPMTRILVPSWEVRSTCGRVGQGYMEIWWFPMRIQYMVLCKCLWMCLHGSPHVYIYDITEVHFKESLGEMHTSPGKPKMLPPWPQHQQVRKLDKMYHASRTEPSADCILNCGITTDDLQAFFTSTKGSLCTSFENLDMPEICSQHFATLSHHSHFDRLVVYADGSSQARSRHIAPQLNEEVGIPDAWCFLVLGETYTSSTTSELSLIGWSSHQVRYGTDPDWHVGADRIGSAIAEREALTWAMIWRIGQNSNIPTLFRSDSLLALQQAKGDIGSLCCDMSFQTLRGCAQLLEAALAPGDFILDHVPGHAGDPYNEFCDWGAKCEGRYGFYCKGPSFLWPHGDHSYRTSGCFLTRRQASLLSEAQDLRWTHQLCLQSRLQLRDSSPLLKPQWLTSPSALPLVMSFHWDKGLQASRASWTICAHNQGFAPELSGSPRDSSRCRFFSPQRHPSPLLWCWQRTWWRWTLVQFSPTNCALQRKGHLSG